MPTVAEVLKSAGMTDEQIAAMDAKAVEGFTTVLSSAEQERLAGETAQRAANDLFEKQITPALNEWGNKEANLVAERDYFKRLAEGAKNGGFIAEVPPFQPNNPRDPNNGRYTANGNPVPGSPDINEFRSQVGAALGMVADLQWNYQKLFGAAMPESPTALGEEAARNRMSLADWAAQKYKFDDRRKQLAQEESQKREDAIRKEEREKTTRELSERYGSNPNVRQGQVSQFAELKKGVTEGTRVDPLKMTPAERKAATSSSIRNDLNAAENTTIQ
ncbi:MAG TPA: hypothetical protein VK638_06350 [Edaphobacter sp.]|nr:hypothetical protein [Edaphobacter sp.]